MCPGVELTDEGMYGLCLRAVSKMTPSQVPKEMIWYMSENCQDAGISLLNPGKTSTRCPDRESRPGFAADAVMDDAVSTSINNDSRQSGVKAFGRIGLKKTSTRLKLFENKVLRKIFGAKRDEITGEWRKLHITELHALYSSPDIIRNIKSRRLRWAGHVARMGESRNAYRVLVGRPEGKRPLGRPRRRCEDNIKMDLREVGYDYKEWINLAQDRDQWRTYVRTAMNLRVP
ncbi:hypothetical protein ANN_06031 [Periplaneta americana]|uniref:Uncharacterized protein n=1 Tax=Periplaneta americana TaxID=6978 RepID=A0ABQ8TEW1_PERAM|nr:hypothetical protein ANN_06031 [Periplaneta americana]